MGLTTPPSKKKLIVTKVEQRKKLGRLNDDGQKKTRYTEVTLATRNVQTMLQTQERMERGSRKRSSSAGSEKMERVGGR